MYRTLLYIMAVMIITGCTGSKTKESLFDEGKKQLEDKKPGTAVVYFRNALEKDQNYADARMELARAYLLMGKHESAEKELRKALLQQPGLHEAHIEMAKACLMAGKPDEALSEIRKTSRDIQAGVEALEIAGGALALKRDYPGAAALLNKAVKAEPTRITARITLARVYLLMGSADAARAEVAGALKIDAADRGALHFLAEIQTSDNDTAAADRTYDSIIEHHPGDTSAFYRKGMLFLQSGRHDQALSISEILIEKFPSVQDGYELRGRTLLSRQEYKDAIVAFQKAVSLRPAVQTSYLLALCLFQNGELEQSTSQLRRILDRNPSFARGRLLSGMIYLKKKKTDEAIAEIRKVLDIEESNALAHSLLGCAYLAKGMTSEGMAELDRALGLDPGLAHARLNKGMFQLSRGKTGEAEAELLAAARTDHDILNSRVLLAVQYLKQNEYGKAVSTAKEGVSGGKTDAILYTIMADAYMQQRNTGEAMKVLVKAHEADPLYADAVFKLAALHQLAGAPDKGIALLKILAERSPGNTKAQLAVAAMMEAAGNEKETTAYYERARKTGTVEGVFEAARHYLKHKHPEKALAVLNDGQRKYPSEPLLHALTGQAYLAQHKVEEAVKVFEELKKLKPEAGLAAIVNAYVEAGMPEKALARVERELKKNPARQELQAEVSLLNIRMGKKREAEENAAAMIGRRPESGLGYTTLAMVHERSGDRQKAIQVLTNASKTNDVDVFMMLGDLHAMDKNFQSALAQYRKAEAIQQNHVPAIFGKANVLHLTGKNKEAIAEYQRVVNLSHNHVPALNNLANLHVEDEKTASAALGYAARAYLLAPEDGAVQDTLGYVLLKNGRVETGLKTLRKAILLLPDNPAVCYHLALALKENNDTAGAVAYLKKALELGEFRQQAEARQLLVRLSAK